MKYLMLTCLLLSFVLYGCKSDEEPIFGFEITRLKDGQSYYLVVDLKPIGINDDISVLEKVKLGGIPSSTPYLLKVQEYTSIHTPDSWKNQKELSLPLKQEINVPKTFLFIAEDEVVHNASEITFIFNNYELTHKIN